MQLAFSTLGCPDWNLETILANASRLGYAGVEFRGLLANIELDQAPEFSSARISKTRQMLADDGVQVTCMSSSVSVLSAVGNENDKQQAITTAQRYIDLACALNAPFVRLFGGMAPAAMTMSEAEERTSRLLRTIGDYAATRNVTVVVETHDYLIHSAQLAHLIHLTNHPAVGVLWDIHHPYRMAGESLTETMQNLHGLVRYTHIKDSSPSQNKEGYTYTALGEGDVPIKESLSVLRAEGYDGFLTLEWEKRWIPELTSPEIAFAQYAEQMRIWLD